MVSSPVSENVLQSPRAFVVVVIVVVCLCLWWIQYGLESKFVSTIQILKLLEPNIKRKCTNIILLTFITFLTLYTMLAITIANIITTILLGQITSQTHKTILYDETITINIFKDITGSN